MPKRPEKKVTIDKKGNSIVSGPDEMDIFIWKKDFEEQKIKQSLRKKKKRVQVLLRSM